MLIDVAKLEIALKHARAEIQGSVFATPPTTLEDLRYRIGVSQGLDTALEIIAAIVKQEDDEE